MIDTHLLVFAGTLSVFLLMALAITVTGLTVFAVVAVVHSVTHARRRNSRVPGPGVESDLDPVWERVRKPGWTAA